MSTGRYSCPNCDKVFTRAENLERHQRSRHAAGPRRRPFNCDLCTASFSRRDVCKRHAERCARGLHSRRRRRQVELQEPPGEQDEREHPSGPREESMYALQNASQEIPPEDFRGSEGLETFQEYDQNIPGSFGNSCLMPNSTQTDNNTMIAPITEAELLPDVTSPISYPSASILTRHGYTYRVASSHAASYFFHFQPFLPIIHRPTFSINESQPALVSIVVAIGSIYSPQPDTRTSIRQISNALWKSGVTEIEILVENDPAMFREPWVFQGWLLHIIYGFYFGDHQTSSKCRSMLQRLIDVLRSLCVLNQDLTFTVNDHWTTHLKRAANWDLEEMHQIWLTFASQESVRLCMFTLFFIDAQISSICNTRPFLSSAESNWDLPPARQIWESSSAEEWLGLVQEAIQKGAFSTKPDTEDPGQVLEIFSVATATQSLLTGKPSSRMLKQLSACPFATMCVVTNLDSLVREFSACYYRMPSVLPDPSAYHVLPPNLNRSIHAAMNCVLNLVDKDKFLNHQTKRLIRLSCWAARLGLCEPDDLLVAGIADTTLASGLATSAHLILGSFVATRRAAVFTRRRFGEDSSMTAWDDLLRSVPVIIESTEDPSVREAPWMTTISYRILLLLWRTLRRAVAEIEQSREAHAAHDVFSPAKIIVHLIHRKLTFLSDEEDTSEPEDPHQVERALVSRMLDIFDTNATYVGLTIHKILAEVGTLINSPQESGEENQHDSLK